MILRIAEILRRSGREERGFTLIELLIVLAIIGILVAIGIPVYNTTMLNAARKAHDSNLRMIDSAVQQYRAGEGSYPKTIDDLTTAGNKYLDELPKIPELLRGDLGADSYTFTFDGEVPWAAPLGEGWTGYRKEATS